MSYRDEADALDTQIRSCIEQWTVPDFNALALRIVAHQLRYNEPYALYCASLGITPEYLPADWQDVPPVPAAAFKEAALCTFDPKRAQLAFETSGTTTGTGGKHYMENSILYDAALLAGFRHGMLAGVQGRLRYLLVVPNPAERPHSSLGYMMAKVADVFGDGDDRWYVSGDTVDADGFCRDAQRVCADGAPVCLAGTAFGLVQLLDGLRERGTRTLPLPQGSRIMETGGFKGRTRVVRREDLYGDLCRMFSLPHERIIAEYGMTELSSQYYDAFVDGTRIKRGPPWMRARVVGPDGKALPAGAVGTLVHVDLANRSSCIAVATEDLGAATPDGGIVLLGREDGAQLRGCSLDAEQLQALTRA